MNISKEPDAMNIPSLVEEYEILRVHDRVKDIEVIKTSFSCRVETYCLISTMSDFYRQSKGEIMRDFLDASCRQFLYAMPAPARRALAEKADLRLRAELQRAYSENSGSIEIEGGYWLPLVVALEQPGEPV
jgi:hypothetical protein